MGTFAASLLIEREGEREKLDWHSEHARAQQLKNEGREEKTGKWNKSLHCPGVGGELLLGEAETVPRAIIGADGSLAGDTLVVLKARADTRGAVADALSGALHVRVRVVGRHGGHRPGSAPAKKKKDGWRGAWVE